MLRRLFAVLFFLGFCTAIHADYFLIRVDLNKPLQKAGTAAPTPGVGPGGPGGFSPGGPGGSPLAPGGSRGPGEGGRPMAPGMGMSPRGSGDGGIYGGGFLDKGEFSLNSRFVFSIVELTKREVLNLPQIVVDESNTIGGSGGAGGLPSPAGLGDGGGAGNPAGGAAVPAGSNLKAAYWVRYLHPFGVAPSATGKTWALATSDTKFDDKGVLFIPNSSMEFHRISEDAGGKMMAMPPVNKYFQDRMSAVKDKTKPANLLPAIQFALEHGLNKEFSEEMEKLAKADPKGKDAVVGSYLKTKKQVEESLPDDSSFNSFAANFAGFNTLGDKHYHVLHDGLPTDPEILEWIKQLELNFRNSYYWFSMMGSPLEMPKNKLKVVLITKPEVYREMYLAILGSRAKTQGFLVPREKLLVLCTKRFDTISEMLSVKNKEWTTTGYDFNQILSGKSGAGYPPTGQILDISYASTLAILNKTLERETIQNTVGNLGTIQLFYANGLFPSSVLLPDWLSEGLGSVFETPFCSPWMNFAGPNSLHLPKFRTTYKSKRNPKEMLAIIDRLFTSDISVEESKRAEIEQMRTDAWALVYFLVKKKTASFLAYCKDLEMMPRDIPLRGAQMRKLFTKHFYKADPDLKKAETAFALEWIEFIFTENLEGERFFSELRRIQDEMLKTQNLDAEVDPTENMLLRLLLTDTVPVGGNPGEAGGPGGVPPGGEGRPGGAPGGSR